MLIQQGRLSRIYPATLTPGAEAPYQGGEAVGRSAQQRGLRSLSRSERVKLLHRSAILINKINMQRDECIERVAQLERVARLLQIRTEPVPAAVIAQGRAGAFQLGKAFEVAEGTTVALASSMSDWAGAGHLFLYAPQDQLMFDPTLDQVSMRIGFPAGLVVLQLEPDELNEDFGVTFNDGCQATYRIVRTDTTWQIGYNMRFAQLGDRARDVLTRALRRVSKVVVAGERSRRGDDR